ncbi:hypothetical protein Cs7R123_64140 [Catellatospora sp. TT07R-123]|uniref:hypothetical protein n=1 Tax=Catellatospora sp. TT07R-123 TaxID=2733863 RepID=UPI001B1D8C09|nr:hypothetical protein [Catellatospora sp. TT07R-123]GHJ49072.1 hypothetical protein Cs7R123_64140 [Catellatospora sp. TT07R-123]
MNAELAIGITAATLVVTVIDLKYRAVLERRKRVEETLNGVVGGRVSGLAHLSSNTRMHFSTTHAVRVEDVERQLDGPPAIRHRDACKIIANTYLASARYVTRDDKSTEEWEQILQQQTIMQIIDFRGGRGGPGVDGSPVPDSPEW